MALNFSEIIEAAKKCEKKRLVLAPARERRNVRAISAAVKADLIEPIFVGDKKTIESLLAETSIGSGSRKIIDVPDNHKSVLFAIEMIRRNRADILMQGAISQQFFFDSILNQQYGLLQSNSASFVSVFETLKKDKLVMVTDTYINNYPSLAEKRLIVENAIALARILGIRTPRIAALAAIEYINPQIPSTVDAAILAKMSERGQFGEAIIEGPLDIDSAGSEIAAQRKGIHSIVPGLVDIYLSPDIESGYLLAQAFYFLGKMPMAGVLLGPNRPIILDVPFVSAENKLIEIALAILMQSGE